jgi:Tfp pilus assembly protein PilN
MINLLPQKQKDELGLEQMFRVIMILGIIILASLICLALMFFFIKMLFGAKLDIVAISGEDKKNMIKILKIEEDEKSISYYNSNFSKLEAIYQKQADVSIMIRELIDLLPQRIYFTNLALTGNKVTVSGYCPERESLVSFKENLENISGFTNVNFSPNDWVKQKDINFSLNFDYVSKE